MTSDCRAPIHQTKVSSVPAHRPYQRPMDPPGLVVSNPSRSFAHVGSGVRWRRDTGARMSTMTKTAQIMVHQLSPAYWRITFDNPPLNVMGPQFVREFRDIMAAIEAAEELRVVVFDSAVDGFFLNHS